MIYICLYHGFMHQTNFHQPEIYGPVRMALLLCMALLVYYYFACIAPVHDALHSSHLCTQLVSMRIVGSPPKHFGDWCSQTSGSSRWRLILNHECENTSPQMLSWRTVFSPTTLLYDIGNLSQQITIFLACWP